MKEVQIGKQIWSAENLSIDTFRNGDLIPEVKTPKDWKNAAKKKLPAWCYYENDVANGKIYGKLYNYYAVIDARGLAPDGWHIPSEEEWTMMANNFAKKAGKRLKSSNGWDSDGNGLKNSVFDALPGGTRNLDGDFWGVGHCGSWWCSKSKWFPEGVWIRSLVSDEDDIARNSVFGGEGYSVRCIKGNEV
jgi:uncharacterized protein (TIGR02145 family)